MPRRSKCMVETQCFKTYAIVVSRKHFHMLFQENVPLLKKLICHHFGILPVSFFRFFARVLFILVSSACAVFDAVLSSLLFRVSAAAPFLTTVVATLAQWSKFL